MVNEPSASARTAIWGNWSAYFLSKSARAIVRRLVQVPLLRAAEQPLVDDVAQD